MNRPNGIPMSVPLLGQQSSSEQNIIVAYRGLYFSLIPVVAAKMLDQQAQSDPMLGQPEGEIPSSIAKEANRIAKAAFKELGIIIE
jgi:hypothetical protein